MSDDDSPCPRSGVRCGSTGLDAMMSLERFRRQDKGRVDVPPAHSQVRKPHIQPQLHPQAQQPQPQQQAQPYMSPISPPLGPGRWRSGSYSPEEFIMTDDREQYHPQPDQYVKSPSPNEKYHLRSPQDEADFLEDDIDQEEEEDILTKDQKLDELNEENIRLHAWNEELHEELSKLSRELNNRHKQSSSIDRLEKKLQDKVQMIDALREKVKELAVREESQRLLYEEKVSRLQDQLGELKERAKSVSRSPQRSVSEDKGEVIARLENEIATLEERQARMTLLEGEREDKINDLEAMLQEKEAQLGRVTQEREEIEGRMCDLQDVVSNMARSIQEIRDKHETSVALKEDVRELHFIIEDLKSEKEALREDYEARLASAERELDAVVDDCKSWQRRYKELRNSMPSHSDDADDHYARQQHHIYEDLSNAVSDTLWLQKVIHCYAANGSLDPELYSGNTEAESDRRHRLDNQSVQKACEVTYEHLRVLKNIIMDCITRQQDQSLLGHDDKGGCDIQ
eukprot:TRINITY_DN7999_c0_g1_i1.p1 TRINITY_DN7999_c0_g1~~TRINITY_DN7999_c0_g1_i1.p1  ORF type:complete len:549 (+),score=220.82 TRINITY_DN7999_c0_g1_i1:111-1649(+)